MIWIKDLGGSDGGHGGDFWVWNHGHPHKHTILNDLQTNYGIVGQTATLGPSHTGTSTVKSHLLFGGSDNNLNQPTTTQFYVNYKNEQHSASGDATGKSTNASGRSYVAILFAHDTSASKMIQCGYKATASTSIPGDVISTVNPQCVWMKKGDTTTGQYWWFVDDMRSAPSQALYNGGSASSNTPELSELAEGHNEQVSLHNSNNSNTLGNKMANIAFMEGGFRECDAKWNSDAYYWMAITKPEYTHVDKITKEEEESGGMCLVWGSQVSGNQTDYGPWMYTTQHMQRHNDGGTLLPGGPSKIAARPIGINLGGTHQAMAHPDYSSNDFMKFTNRGFVLGNAFHNVASQHSWTFRRRTRFFDQVLVTGNGVNNSGQTASNQVTHNLGVKPGMIWVRNLDQGSAPWCLAVLDTATNRYWVGDNSGTNYYLNGQTDAHYNLSVLQSNTLATDQYVDIGKIVRNASDPTGWAINVSNISSQKYLVTLFAHDTSDDSMIKCGTYTGTSSAIANTAPYIQLGWTPQAVFVKCVDDNSAGTALLCGNFFSSHLGMFNGVDYSGNVSMNGQGGVHYKVGKQYSSNNSYQGNPIMPQHDGFRVYGSTGSNQGTLYSFSSELHDNTNKANHVYFYMAIKEGIIKDVGHTPDFAKMCVGRYGQAGTYLSNLHGRHTSGGIDSLGTGYYMGWRPDFIITRPLRDTNLTTSQNAKGEKGFNVQCKYMDAYHLSRWGQQAGITHTGTQSEGMITGSTYSEIGGTSNVTSNADDTDMAFALRKCEKAFDVVTWHGYGDGQSIDYSRQIKHKLTVAPEMIMAWQPGNKDGNPNSNFGLSPYGTVWHKDFGSLGYNNNYALKWCDDNSFDDIESYTGTNRPWGTANSGPNPTATTFEVGFINSNGGGANPASKSGMVHCAALFASKEGRTKVGSWTGNSSSTTTVNFGFYPRCIWIKALNTGQSSWHEEAGWMYLIRTTYGYNTPDFKLWWLDKGYASQSMNAEVSTNGGAGINIQSTSTWLNTTGRKYIYVAFSADELTGSDRSTDTASTHSHYPTMGRGTNSTPDAWKHYTGNPRDTRSYKL
tara:strand:- start:361 stop:3564 length:3204 start_codon:yes stop_codon:yes gene_type:complete